MAVFNKESDMNLEEIYAKVRSGEMLMSEFEAYMEDQFDQCYLLGANSCP